ncbi:MAG: hypothetical protein Q9181_001686 [Wetmoreana brouardii]
MAAYGLSPQPTASLVAGSSSSRLHRSSPTPPPPTKREKRKNAMIERLRDISADFTENREYHYRRQLQALQRDVNFITYAEPYQNRPLDEIDEDYDMDGIASAPGSILGNGGKQPRAGKWARRFVEEVNNAMEDRDAQLTLIADRHNFRIRELKDDYDYWVTVAEKECSNLLTTLRARLKQNLEQKKATLLKERDKLELSDSSSLLLNPNQFSFANPASPGGPQSNRKTRHTRHRLDVDDTGSMGENKRKRKLAADADEGSPGPSNRIADVEVPVLPKDSQAKVDPYQSLAPAYSMGHLFTDKELITTTQEASYAAVSDILSKRKKSNKLLSYGKFEATTPKTNRVHRANNRNGKRPNGSTNPTTANVTDAEDNVDTSLPAQTDGGADEAFSDDVFLVAPAMDRTANSSIHATRSTRNNGLGLGFMTNGSPLQTLGDLAGRASAIKLLGSHTKERKQGPEDYNRAPPLTDQEVDDDLALIAAALKDGEKSPGKMNTKLVDDLCAQQVDYTNDGEGEVSDLRGSRSSSATV